MDAPSPSGAQSPSDAPPLEAVLAPIRLGGVQLRNRIVSTSHQTGLVHQNLPTDDLIAYHEARARGGVGAIFLEATAVHPTGLLTDHTLGGFLPAIVPSYRRLTQAVKAHGARLFVQLFHGGREQIADAPRPPAVAPSAVPSPRFKCEPRSLTAAEIRELIAGYADAARHAVEGGLDGIELSFAHGYLVAQFISPQTNRRVDAYGGSEEGRLRFAREVLAAVREVAGGLAVGVRLSAEERIPGGLDAAACARVANALRRDGLLDFVSLALGHSAHPAASTWIAPPPPAAAAAIAGPAAAVRRQLPGLPVIATTRIVELGQAAEMITSGAADLVGMTRALIADPDLLAKIKGGRSNEVIECIGCNQGCIGHYHAGVPIACAVNPRTGHERKPTAPRTRHRRSVLVIGAGPAGIAAALQAAACGDAVTLVEAQEQIGGQLRLAGLAPAHQELWSRYLRSTLARLHAAGVRPELGVRADGALAAGFGLVVLATGARPYQPPLPAEQPFATVNAWEAIADCQRLASPALVADWGGGWDGLDAAERLAHAGVSVTLVCGGLHPGETLHQYQRNLYLARLDCAGVRIVHHHELALDGGELGLRHVFSGRRRPLPPIATLVLAQGRVPVDELWPRLTQHPAAVRAGDVLGPRTLEEAVREGTLAVR
jgi:2,4-dienoyl-CoA reductase-like NADH-dependent reductase (Old Yellow Enzyme family)